MDKIRTTVHIFGRDYAMSSYDSEEYVQRVARYVDRKMTEISLSTSLPETQMTVLAALNIADDMLKAHDENNRLKKELSETRRALESARAEAERLRAQP